MQYFQNFEYEIKINIFKYVNYPLNLALACQNWSVIAKDPYAKTEWLIEHHGEEHALFHAVKLGITFIDMMVCQSLIERKVITSRYFIQMLIKHFRIYNQKLIKLRIGHNFGQLEVDKDNAFQQNIQSSWARNLLTFVFTHLLLANESQSTSTNAKKNLKDTMLTNNHVNNVFAGLKNNSKYIEDLIKKLIIFPLKSLRLDFNNASCTNQPLIPQKYLSINKIDSIKYFDFLQQESFSRYDINKLFLVFLLIS